MNSLLDKWRQHVEVHKFTGPTVKILKIDDDTWAILDHEYNLVDVCTQRALNEAVPDVKHPPQRERPKPQLFSFDFETNKATPINEINTEGLDL